jgi:hypothetical protein
MSSDEHQHAVAVRRGPEAVLAKRRHRGDHRAVAAVQRRRVEEVTPCRCACREIHPRAQRLPPPLRDVSVDHVVGNSELYRVGPRNDAGERVLVERREQRDGIVEPGGQVAHPPSLSTWAAKITMPARSVDRPPSRLERMDGPNRTAEGRRFAEPARRADHDRACRTSGARQGRALSVKRSDRCSRTSDTVPTKFSPARTPHSRCRDALTRVMRQARSCRVRQRRTPSSRSQTRHDHGAEHGAGSRSGARSARSVSKRDGGRRAVRRVGWDVRKLGTACDATGDCGTIAGGLARDTIVCAYSRSRDAKGGVASGGAPAVTGR